MAHGEEGEILAQAVAVETPTRGFQRFEDMGVWRKARELARDVYRVTREPGFARDFGLRDQIRRAAVSVLSNIAEGFERDGAGDFARFLTMAKGSAGEVRAQLYVALDQGYLTGQEFEALSGLAGEVSRMTAGLIAHLRRSNQA